MVLRIAGYGAAVGLGRPRRPDPRLHGRDLQPALGGGPAPTPPDAELGPAIARLATDEQSLLALRFGRDLTVPEIADA